jgi:hypothetical protein
MTDTESIRKGSRILVTILILFAITAGVGWYFLSSQSAPLEAVPAVASEAEPVATFEPVVEAPVQEEPHAEPEAETVAELEPATSSLTEAELEVEPESVVAEPEPTISATVETTPEAETTLDVAPDTQVQIGKPAGCRRYGISQCGNFVQSAGSS